MSNIGNMCEYCEEQSCIGCPLGSPCLHCEDYDKINDICKNGGCALERRTDG